MASDAAVQAEARLEGVRQQRRPLVVGLLWGFVALALLTWWLYVKDREDAFAVVLGTGVLALAALALAFWQLRAGRAAGSAEQAEAALGRQRRPLALAVFALAGVLLLLLIWLAAQRGLAVSFPELSSGLVLVLTGLGAGVLLLLAPAGGLGQEHILQGLVIRRRGLMIALFVGGVIFLAAGIVAWSREGLRPGFPEVATGILLGLLFAGGGLWLFLSLGTPLTATNLRLLILAVGGMAGLIVAVLTIVRAVLWWDEVFAAGIRSWQGEASWRLWVCFYAELLGLAVLFCSLLLAYADIRVNVLLRRLLFGYNTVLTGLLLLAILVVVNVTVYACYPYTFEWTKSRGLYSLSTKSKSTLDALKEPTTVYVLMSQGDRNFRDVRTLLANVQAYTTHVQVQYISPDLQVERFRELLDRYPKARQEGARGARGLLVVYGPESGKQVAPHAFIPTFSLSEEKATGAGARSGVREFKGEDLFMTELRSLLRGGTRPVIYFTQGRGELDMRDMELGSRYGTGLFVDWLRKKRYDPKGLTWGPAGKKKGPAGEGKYTQEGPDEPHRIPTDALAVIIADPRALFEPEILKALEVYLDGKGKLLVLHNFYVKPETQRPIDTGLKGLLAKYGVKLGDDFILNAELRVPVINIAVPPARSRNPIALAFQEKAQFPVVQARTVRPEGGASGYRAETILEVASPPNPPLFWAETDPRNLINSSAYVRSLSRQQLLELRSPEPVPVGVAVSKDQPVMVVFGDAIMISNDDTFKNVPYFDLMDNALAWLAGRPENIGIPPRNNTFFRFSTPPNLPRMIFLPVALVLIGLVGLGAGVWVVRRR